MLGILVSLISTIGVLVILPLVVFTHLRTKPVSRRAQWRPLLLLAILSLPLLLTIGVTRPFGGSVWSLADWIPKVHLPKAGS